MPCPYAYVLGIPGQGVHAKRIFGYALNDFLATLFAAALYAYFTKSSFIASAIALFIIGEILHYIFGVQTAVLTNLGINADCQG